MMTVNNLVNSFLAFVAIFIIAPSIAFGVPYREFHPLAWYNGTNEVTAAFITFSLWTAFGLWTRLERVRRQTWHSLEAEEAMNLLTPLAAPGISGLFVGLAFFIGQFQLHRTEFSFWMSLAALLGSSLALIAVVMFYERQMRIVRV